jgi:hypothetical protein
MDSYLAHVTQSLYNSIDLYILSRFAARLCAHGLLVVHLESFGLVVPVAGQYFVDGLGHCMEKSLESLSANSLKVVELLKGPTVQTVMSMLLRWRPVPRVLSQLKIGLKSGRARDFYAETRASHSQVWRRALLTRSALVVLPVPSCSLINGHSVPAIGAMHIAMQQL